MEYYKNNLTSFFWLLLAAYMVMSSGGCQSSSSPIVDRDAYNQGLGCPTTELLSETLSPDGKLRAAVFKYEDTCQKSWGKREMVAVLPNDGSIARFKPYAMIIYGGGLRPMWTGNKELLIRGERSKYAQYNKNGFFNINVPASNGETITHKIGWFDSVQVTYKDEKFQIQNELVSQTDRPPGFPGKVYPLVTRAAIYRQKCLRESDQTVSEENLFVSLYEEPLKPNLKLSLECGELGGDIYKTTVDDRIHLKWLSEKELLIISSQPEGEKKFIRKEYGWVSVKYQQGEQTN